MLEIGLGVSGRFTLEKRVGDTITERRSWHNVVLDSAFNNLVAALHGTDAYTVAQYLFFGTGTTEPTRIDTGLEVRGGLPGKAVAGITTTGYLDGIKGDRFADVVLRYSFGAGEAQGVWTELGTASDAEYTLPFNRALIRDENGYPTPLRVTSEESLTVYLELRLREAIGYPMRTSFILPDGSETKATVTPLDASAYTHTGTGNVWRAGFANRHGKLLNASREELTYLTLPWPYDPPESTIKPVVSYEHNVNTRTTRMNFYLGASNSEVWVDGIGFGPGTDWIYRMMFDEPFSKPFLQSLEFAATIQFYRTATD